MGPGGADSLLKVLESKLKHNDINGYFNELDNSIYKLISLDKSASRDDFQKLLRLRTFPPILALYAIHKGLSPDLNTARGVALKSSLIAENLRYLAQALEFDAPREVVDLYESMRRLSEGRNGDSIPEEKFVKVIVIDIGEKQRTITRTGGFKDMRGASLLIDVVPRIVADLIKDKLGYEFILTMEAGELVFLSTQDLIKDLKGEVLERIREIRFSDTLIIKMNFETTLSFSISDLLKMAGDSYVLSLSSCRVEGDRDHALVEVSPENLCQSCRNEETVNDLEGELRSVYNPVDSLISFIERDFGSRKICRKCLAHWVYGHALVQLLNGKKGSWSEEIRKVIESSNTFKILDKLKEHAKKRGMSPVFVTNLDEYNYEDSNALIAMVSADGDRFGRLKSGANSLAELYGRNTLFTILMGESFLSGSIASLDFENGILECLGKSSSQSGENLKIPVTPIFIAGDDMLFVIRAEHLLNFAKGFHERAYEIAERARKLGVIDSTIGVSMGAAVARTRVPGLFLYRSSHEVQRGLKEVVRNSDLNFNFATHIHMAYLKSSASWGLVNRVSNLIPHRSSPSNVLGDKVGSIRKWLIWMGDKTKSPLLKSLYMAWDASHGETAPLRGTHLKEVLEDLLTRKLPYIAVLRWMSDVARLLPEESKEDEANPQEVRARREMKIIKELYGDSLEPPELAWLPIYLISSLLDMIENRLEGEIGQGVDLEDLITCVGGLI